MPLTNLDATQKRNYKKAVDDLHQWIVGEDYYKTGTGYTHVSMESTEEQNLNKYYKEVKQGQLIAPDAICGPIEARQM